MFFVFFIFMLFFFFVFSFMVCFFLSFLNLSFYGFRRFFSSFFFFKKNLSFYGFRRFLFLFVIFFFIFFLLVLFPSSQETLLSFPSFVFLFGFFRGRKTFSYCFRRWTFGGFCRRRRIHDFGMYRAIPRFFLCF